MTCGPPGGRYGSGAAPCRPAGSLRPPGGVNRTARAAGPRGRPTAPPPRRLRIGLPALPAGRTITADGTLDAPATVVDEPGTFFHPVFLARHDDPRVDYGTAEDHH